MGRVARESLRLEEGVLRLMLAGLVGPRRASEGGSLSLGLE